LNPLACTPQLLIIGAPNAGTTAVFDYLNGTIAGFTVHSKEAHFLNGSAASKQYIVDLEKLPVEKRR
jgi:Fe2+ transport system protein B